MRSGVDLTFDFGDNLTEGEVLWQLQQLLEEVAPHWSAGLHVHRGRAEGLPISLRRRDALLNAVAEAGSARGALFRSLTAKDLRTSERSFGSVELRGASPALTIVISFDDAAFPRAGSLLYWGNVITFQIRRTKIDASNSSEWSQATFRRGVKRLKPWYGHAASTAEFDSKNMISDAYGTHAVGIDISASLPGIYWLNYFGAPICDVLKKDIVRTAPAYKVEEISDGVLLELSATPADWDSPEYRERERRVLRHLGPEYFFSKEDPNRTTRPPLAVLLPQHEGPFNSSEV